MKDAALATRQGKSWALGPYLYRKEFEMEEKKSQRCGLYKPGHLTHFVQSRVMRDKPRFPARVELVTHNQVRVTTDLADELYFYHEAPELYLKCLDAYQANVTFSPEANLLWVQVDGPTETTKGAFFPAYLTQDELTECETLDPKIRYLRLPWSDGDSKSRP